MTGDSILEKSFIIISLWSVNMKFHLNTYFWLVLFMKREQVHKPSRPSRDGDNRGVGGQQSSISPAPSRVPSPWLTVFRPTQTLGCQSKQGLGGERGGPCASKHFFKTYLIKVLLSQVRNCFVYFQIICQLYILRGFHNFNTPIK